MICKTLPSIARSFLLAGVAAALTACGSASPGTMATTSAVASVYPAAYQAAKWQPNVTATYPSACTMAYTTNGIPAVHNNYYLAPAANGQTVVAATPVSYELRSAIPEMRKPIAPIGATVVIGFALDG